jgi:hypothetical protein
MREGKNMGIMTTFKKPTLESPRGGDTTSWAVRRAPSCRPCLPRPCSTRCGLKGVPREAGNPAGAPACSCGTRLPPSRCASARLTPSGC